jgi:hypothetical protein
MKKRLVTIIVLFCMVSAVPVYAGYGSTAYGGTGKETFLNRASDWFATVGKPQEEKYRILHQRRTIRKIKNAKKKINAQKRDLAEKRKVSK